MNTFRAIAWLALPLITASLAVSAQGLYRWIDKDGNVTYSDAPPPKDAKGVQKKKLGDNVVASENDNMPFAVKNAMQRNPVILYANNCGEACDQSRALLSKRGVPFVNRNPETDPGAAEALKDLVGQLSVPTLAVGTNSVTGFSESAWNSALDVAGYPRFNVLGNARVAPNAPAPGSVPTPVPASISPPASPAQPR